MVSFKTGVDTVAKARDLGRYDQVSRLEVLLNRKALGSGYSDYYKATLAESAEGIQAAMGKILQIYYKTAESSMRASVDRIEACKTVRLSPGRGGIIAARVAAPVLIGAAAVIGAERLTRHASWRQRVEDRFKPLQERGSAR